MAKNATVCLETLAVIAGFCGENAIPLTIGGVYFGFNQTTMDRASLRVNYTAWYFANCTFSMLKRTC